MTPRLTLYRRGQRVSVRDVNAGRWREGRVVRPRLAKCTVAVREPGSNIETWFVVPTTPAWIRPVHVVAGAAA